MDHLTRLTQRYGPAIAPLIADERLNPLDGGEPHGAVLGALERLTVDSAFAGFNIQDRAMAAAVISGLWLYHNYLERSHAISQSIANATGSFWHAIMHRREPDAANSAYWFRRVGEHPIFPELRAAARAEAAGARLAPHAAFLLDQRHWNPFAFIDLCEACRGSGDATEALCRRIQLREWKLLFEYSFDQAVVGGRPLAGEA